MKRTPKDTATGSRRLTRRALFVGGLQASFIGVLAWRMRFLQVDQADEFRMLAEENRINIRLIPPARGEIFDRNGVAIARNEPAYRITIVREDAGDIDTVLGRLSHLVKLDPEEIERAMTEMKRSAPFLPITLADRVSWEDVSRIAVNTPALPGITPEVGLSRGYPLAQDFAHVVGYVGPVSDYDLSKLEDPDQLLRIPRFQIGKVGLEAKMEDQLRGSAGARRVEVNAVGRVMRELDRREGVPGANLQLTTDYRLQNYVQARLAGESAAAVVIDCEHGDLLAVGSAPTFDPNLFVEGISVTDYRALTENKYRPLAAKAVQGIYPPGSTFKMVVALAGLEAGVIGPEDTFYCPGYIEVSNRRFHCWKRGGHGSVNLEGSLQHSCDVFYYELAMQVGIEKISEMAMKLGIGVHHDLPMSAVATGLAPTKEWKRTVRGQDWVIGDTVNSAIGQGFVLASPLQLAIMASRVATGRNVTPRIIKSIDGVEQPSGSGESLGLNPNNLRHVRQGMFEVSNNRRGTGYGARIIAEGYRMAGKSGTSQVRNISAAERAAGVTSNADLPWERRDHALWVDFAPFDNPKVAVCVVVEHGSGGSSTAAPIARDITLQALFEGDPPLDAYPAKDRDAVRERQERLRALRPDVEREKKSRA
ncbi:penicillin-binding protein 2 [Pseudooceanicola sediminis]|uniref:Penicillin-binding protein 2 n=1 Tax=Pseudooceanicola sediminis TaxID=2211117 RepID=A0A399IXU7_9RHOB|nr:penicillin-binding protein 2 [Pseudooceanicola sediminis]RII37935.1 penicillin-binding protein 2 [Pseudooceanicola sediminis]|tara:strand:- start:37947 stop:39890 length:1944 start_codon:yes stop_codon:yes gene_type:complete